MKILIKKVYYCDYCKKKKGLSASAMTLHERHCTLNPNRICGVCEVYNIRNKEDCPMCEFSKLRITSLKTGLPIPSYDLEKEMNKFWEKERFKEEQSSIYG